MLVVVAIVMVEDVIMIYWLKNVPHCVHYTSLRITPSYTDVIHRLMDDEEKNIYFQKISMTEK